MPPRATRTVENSFHRLGYPRVAGVDEVGRGCLAGPVAVGVVVLDPRRPRSRPAGFEAADTGGARAAGAAASSATRWPGGWAGPSPTRSTPSTSTRRPCGPWRAASWRSIRSVGRAGRRLRHPRTASAAARHHRRRSAVRRHRRGVDCGQSRAGPILSRCTTPILVMGSTVTRGTRPPNTWRPSHGTGTAGHRRSFLCRAFHTPTLFDTIE